MKRTVCSKSSIFRFLGVFLVSVEAAFGDCSEGDFGVDTFFDLSPPPTVLPLGIGDFMITGDLRSSEATSGTVEDDFLGGTDFTFFELSLMVLALL